MALGRCGSARSMLSTSTSATALGPTRLKMTESVYKRTGSKLMALQGKNTNPWLLFVTSRIGHGKFDADAEEQLVMSLFRNNVDSLRRIR